MSALTHKVMNVVRSYLARQGVSVELGVADKLRDCGLTSVQLVSLIFVVETAFDIAIPDSELTPGNFASVDTIARMLCTLRADLVTYTEGPESVRDVHGSEE
jgi:acyl carrier protein